MQNSDAQARSFFKQAIMRAQLGQRHDLKDKLPDAMSAKANPVQWLEMAMDPNAFTGMRLPSRTARINRAIILKHVATSWIVDPAQPGLGTAMAEAIKRPIGGNGYYATLAFEIFAKIINAAELPAITGEIATKNAFALATAIMHRMIDAEPKERAIGKQLREKLDRGLADYITPTLPLSLAAANFVPNRLRHTRTP